MANSSTKVKNKSRKPMRDIKATGSNSTRGSFTVRQLQKEDAPEVEPLLEESATGEAGFQVDKIDKEDFYQSQQSQNNQDSDYDEPKMDVTPVNENAESDESDQLVEDFVDEYMPNEVEDLPPKDTVRVKFGKFVHLVANHDFKEVIAANKDEDIIMSSNLLTELAGSHDSRGERRIPLVFLVGIAIGVVLTYILFST